MHKLVYNLIVIQIDRKFASFALCTLPLRLYFFTKSYKNIKWLIHKKKLKINFKKIKNRTLICKSFIEKIPFGMKNNFSEI